MSAAELATMAVTAMTTGIASSAGSAVVDEVKELVRSRLGESHDGRSAMERFETEPAADGAASAVRERLVLVLEADPEFSGRLWTALQPAALPPQPPQPPQPPTAVTQGIHIGGNANRSTIVIGPVQLPRTRGVVIALTAVGTVLAVLLVIGFRSVLDGFGADGSPGRSGSTGKVATLKDSATTETVLPDSGSLPAGWRVARAAEVTEGVPADCSSSCEGVRFTAGVGYGNEEAAASAYFYVQAYDTAAHAAQRFEDLRSDRDDSSTMSLPPMGNESVAFRRGVVNAEKAEAGVRVGTVVTWVTYTTGSGELSPSALTSLARMLSDRAQQAQDGTEPFARAEF
ncbi:hypothetical protein [Streptomyces sp. NPDC093225]|uniref:hypothetical protein n=1 Tax=Streptomyces sp. NPDC093225 TaxID=3366034 RepID=UPI00381472D5